MNKIEFIARVRHLGWVCYQIAVHQNFNVKPSHEQLASLKNGVQFALNNPKMTSKENHENWMKMKASQGWKFGLAKDFTSKTHPDMVPFDELPEVEKRKDGMDKIMNEEAEVLWDTLMTEYCGVL